MLKEKAGILMPSKIATSNPKAKEFVCSILVVKDCEYLKQLEEQGNLQELFPSV